MIARSRAGVLTVVGLAALSLQAPPAMARTFRCSISAEDYGHIVASGINPVSPDVGKAVPSAAACIVADYVVLEATLKLSMDHLDNPHKPYPTSLKLTLNRPGDVNAIEIWRYRIRYPAKGSMHGFGVATCANQKVTFILLPNPPKVIGS